MEIDASGDTLLFKVLLHNIIQTLNERNLFSHIKEYKILIECLINLIPSIYYIDNTFLIILLQFCISLVYPADKFTHPANQSTHPADQSTYPSDHSSLTSDYMQLRHSAMELIINVVEIIPSTIRTMTESIQQILSTLLFWNSLLSENDQWDDGDEYDLDDHDVAAGEEFLDRFSNALGSIIGPYIFIHVKDYYLNSEWWYRRHGGLFALAVSAEGCYDYFLTILTDLVYIFMTFSRDSHPRVRWAACNLIGQLCTDFYPKIQTEFNDKILTHLISVLQENIKSVDLVPHSYRVSRHVCSALINFCVDADANWLLPYTPTLLESLYPLTNRNCPLQVLIEVVSVITSLTQVIHLHFKPYYSYFMPFFMSLLTETDKRNYHFNILWTKCIEAVTVICEAVGNEANASDISTILQILQSPLLWDGLDENDTLQTTQSNEYEIDYNQISFILDAWVRIGKLSKAGLTPYVDFLLPRLLNGVKKDVVIRIYSVDNTTTELKDIDMWKTITVGTHTICILISSLHLRRAACRALLYLIEAKERLTSYFLPITLSLFPLLLFYYDDETRILAASCLPSLLNLVFECEGKEKAFEFWNLMYSPLCDAILKEMVGDVICVFLSSLMQCFILMETASHNQERLQVTTNLLTTALNNHFTAQKKKINRYSGMLDSTEQNKLQTQLQKDDQLIIIIYQIHLTLFRQYGIEYLTSFEKTLPILLRLITQPSPLHQLEMSLIFLSHLLDILHGVAFCYFEDSFEYIIRHLNNENNNIIKMSVVILVGQIAEFSSSGNELHWIEMVTTILSLSQLHFSNQNPVDIKLHKCCIWAIGKISRHLLIPHLTSSLHYFIKNFPCLFLSEPTSVTSGIHFEIPYSASRLLLESSQCLVYHSQRNSPSFWREFGHLFHPIIIAFDQFFQTEKSEFHFYSQITEMIKEYQNYSLNIKNII
jgi:importin-5